MRHFRSILYVLVLAPAVWVLAGVGLTHDLTTRGRGDFAVESATGLLLLVLAGAAYAILLFAPISPAGPLAGGVGYLGVSLWALVSPSGYAGAWPAAVAKESFDLSRPGYGLAALLAVPLICTALSAKRWARFEAPVLPLVGQLGRARGKATVAAPAWATQVSGSTPVLRPTDPDPTAALRLPVVPGANDPTVVVPAAVLPAEEPTAAVAAHATDEGNATTVLPSAEPTTSGMRAETIDHDEPTAAGEDGPSEAATVHATDHEETTAVFPSKEPTGDVTTGLPTGKSAAAEAHVETAGVTTVEHAADTTASLSADKSTADGTQVDAAVEEAVASSTRAATAGDDEPTADVASAGPTAPGENAAPASDDDEYDTSEDEATYAMPIRRHERQTAVVVSSDEAAVVVALYNGQASTKRTWIQRPPTAPAVNAVTPGAFDPVDPAPANDSLAAIEAVAVKYAEFEAGKDITADLTTGEIVAEPAPANATPGNATVNAIADNATADITAANAISDRIAEDVITAATADIATSDGTAEIATTDGTADKPATHGIAANATTTVGNATTDATAENATTRGLAETAITNGATDNATAEVAGDRVAAVAPVRESDVTPVVAASAAEGVRGDFEAAHSDSVDETAALRLNADGETGQAEDTGLETAVSRAEATPADKPDARRVHAADRGQRNGMRADAQSTKADTILAGDAETKPAEINFARAEAAPAETVDRAGRVGAAAVADQSLDELSDPKKVGETGPEDSAAEAVPSSDLDSTITSDAAEEPDTNPAASTQVDDSAPQAGDAEAPALQQGEGSEATADLIGAGTASGGDADEGGAAGEVTADVSERQVAEDDGAGAGESAAGEVGRGEQGDDDEGDAAGGEPVADIFYVTARAKPAPHSRGVPPELEETRSLEAPDPERTRAINLRELTTKLQITPGGETEPERAAANEPVKARASAAVPEDLFDPERTRSLSAPDPERTQTIQLATAHQTPADPDRTHAITIVTSDDAEVTRSFSAPDPERTQTIHLAPADDTEVTRSFSAPDPDQTQALRIVTSQGEVTGSVTAPDPEHTTVVRIGELAEAMRLLPPVPPADIATHPGRVEESRAGGAFTGDLGGDETQVIRLDPDRTQIIRPGSVEPPGERTEFIRLPAPVAAPPEETAGKPAPASIADAERPNFAEDPTSRIVPPGADGEPENGGSGRREMTVMSMERPPEDDEPEIPAQRRPSAAES